MVRVLVEVILHLSLSNHRPLFIQSLSWLVRSPTPPPPPTLCCWNVFGGAPPRQTHFHPHSFKNLYPWRSDGPIEAKHYCNPASIKSKIKKERDIKCKLWICPNSSLECFWFVLSGCSRSHQCHRLYSVRGKAKGQWTEPNELLHSNVNLMTSGSEVCRHSATEQH